MPTALPFSACAQQQPLPPVPAVHVGQQAPDVTSRHLARGPDDKFAQKTISLADFESSVKNDECRIENG